MDREREFNGKRKGKTTIELSEIEELDLKKCFKNWKENNYSIHIFDIDGCITTSFFPNIEKIVDIQETKLILSSAKLFFFFKIYFSSIPKDNLTKVYFLTGRKTEYYREETINLLSELGVKEDQIIFYPNNYTYSRLRYFTFKTYNCLRIILKDKKKSKVYIYDDLPDYFPKLRKILKNQEYFNVSYYEIRDQIDWSYIS
ncbi:unnamed protein product, partial [marine sediment metagenome]